MLQQPNPRFRFERVLDKTRRNGVYDTDHALEEALVRLLLDKDGVPEEVLHAYRIFKDDYKREVIEAFLLAGGDGQDLHQIFRIDEKTVEVYSTLFFDTEVFHDRLDAESYARGYPTNHDDGFGREKKIEAIENGLEYLKAAFGRGNYQVSPEQAVREMISQSYILSKAAAKFPLDHKKAQEARQWASTMLSSIGSIPDAQQAESGDRQNFLLKLQFESTDEDPNAVDPEEISEEDIVHQQTYNEDDS